MKILIAGGSGFLGTSLINKLILLNHSAVLLTRNPKKTRQANPSLQVEQWDAVTVGSWNRHLESVDVIVNLTGESIGGRRWTRQQKNLILSSRVSATRAIVEAIEGAKRKPKVLVNQSAVGYYGNVEEGEVTEEHPRGNDFLSDVCEAWEKEARRAEASGIRVVLTRTGLVLDNRGGALPRMLLPFKLFAGGPLGNGTQWFPWIHLEDEINALVFAAEREHLSGPVNLAAPGAVTMKQFCTTLGRVMRRPSWAPVPGFVLKIALGEMAGPLLLSGQRVVPKKLVEAGFQFRFPTLEEALRNILD